MELRRLLLAAVALAGCTRVTRGERETINPHFTREQVLDPVVVRPSNHTQKAFYDLMEASVRQAYDWSTGFRREFVANVAAGRVFADDDVRIDVQLWHEWPDLADPRQYEVYLRTDGGPPLRGTVRATHMKPFSYRGETTAVNMTRLRDSPSMQSFAVGAIERDMWRGRAKLRFYGQPLVTHSTRGLTLEMRNPRQAFVFRWQLVIPPQGSGQHVVAPPPDAHP